MRVTIAASAEPRVNAGINRCCNALQKAAKISGNQTVE